MKSGLCLRLSLWHGLSLTHGTVKIYTNRKKKLHIPKLATILPIYDKTQSYFDTTAMHTTCLEDIGALTYPVNMPQRALTGPELGRCYRHRPGSGPVKACLQGTRWWRHKTGELNTVFALSVARVSTPDIKGVKTEFNNIVISIPNFVGMKI